MKIFTSLKRRSSRLDKKRWTQARLEEGHTGGPVQRWKKIRRVRSKYQPRRQTVHWPDGRTWTQKAEVLAQRQKSNVWKEQDFPLPIYDPILPAHLELFVPFQMSELLQAARRMKSRKAPGPDDMTAECWRFLPHQITQLLLRHFNDCFLGECAPEHWKLAKVVVLFEGGTKNSQSPSSYRPILLVNNIYKLYAYATLLQQRLFASLEPHLSPQQFGFRKNRSLNTPQFISRRLLKIFASHDVIICFVSGLVPTFWLRSPLANSGFAPPLRGTWTVCSCCHVNLSGNHFLCTGWSTAVLDLLPAEGNSPRVPAWPILVYHYLVFSHARFFTTNMKYFFVIDHGHTPQNTRLSMLNMRMTLFWWHGRSRPSTNFCNIALCFTYQLCSCCFGSDLRGGGHSKVSRNYDLSQQRTQCRSGLPLFSGCNRLPLPFPVFTHPQIHPKGKFQIYA